MHVLAKCANRGSGEHATWLDGNMCVGERDGVGGDVVPGLFYLAAREASERGGGHTTIQQYVGDPWASAIGHIAHPARCYLLTGVIQDMAEGSRG